ncbi:MAG: diaminopimelate epimerase [Duncaniella sp.]|nr:diaminopimelate epimerase [Duncaniella sp.]
MAEIRFTKMHGIGNDYIYINCMESTVDDPASLSVKLSDRHTGIGGDGIILILPSTIADFKMRIFNADGSEATMCGNGSRCVAKYVSDHGLTDRKVITLETLSGIKTLTLHTGTDGLVDEVTVDMGEPAFDAGAIPVVCRSAKMVDFPVKTSRGDVRLTAVSMGNPHGVVFVDSLDTIDFDTLGPELERHPMWPDRANIELVEVVSRERLKMRVWERGSGETMACGTGACATAVAAALTGRADREVTVSLRGGDLRIKWGDDGHVYMTGPATEVFNGTVIV